MDGRKKRPVIRRILIYQTPLVVYAALIYIVSSISRLPTPDFGLTFADKIIHIIEYGLFCFLALRALKNPPLDFSPGPACIFAIGITVLYAALDEYHQSFVPGRNADMYDLLADILGAAVALLLFHVAKRRPRMSL